MTLIDPSTHTGTQSSSTSTTPVSTVATRAPEPAATPQPTGRFGTAPTDALDTEVIPGTRTTTFDPGLSAADAGNRLLLDEVLAELETETDSLDDARAAIKAAGAERQALAARRVAVALELERAGGGRDRNDAALTSGGGVRLLSPEDQTGLHPPPLGEVFVTEGGFRIDYEGHETRIYEPDESGRWQLNTRIWGDPHVDEKGTGDGDDWHFGEDSTFILPDGTKLSLNTKETEPGNGIYFTVGIDIQSGTQRAFAGEGFDGTKRAAGVAEDRVEFDMMHADTKGTSGGVFALIGAQWAKLGAQGFQDVESESWQGYLATRDARGAGELLTVTDQQALAVSGAMDPNAPSSRARASDLDALTGAALDAYRGELQVQMDSLDKKLHETSKTLFGLLAAVTEQNMSGTDRADEAVKGAMDAMSRAYEGQTLGGAGQTRAPAKPLQGS